MPKIFITSHPYVYERYFKVFDHFKNKENLIFILPKKWKTRAGFIAPPKRHNIKIIPVIAYFYGSKHPIIRGLLKGWMPGAKRIIREQAKPGDVLFTAGEPNLLTTLINSRLAQKIGLKHVFFTWQNIDYRKRLKGLKLKFTEKIIRNCVNKSVGAICGNTKAEQILKNYTPIGFKFLQVPISGVDTERFQPGIQSNFRQKYGLNGNFLITFAGVIDERKGILTLVRAFKTVYEALPEARLVIIGTGPLRSQTERIAGELGVAGKVIFINWLANEELPGVFCSSDIFAYPSEPFGGWEEQFGYSMAEASACGIPVISTNIGSIDEVVINRQTGIIIKPQKPEELVKAILELAGNTQLCRKMGQVGREYIVKNFSHLVVAEKMENWLNSL